MASEGRIEQPALPVAEPAPRLEVVEPLSYPDSDGHFLPPNPLQANAIVELRVSMRQHFHDIPNVVVEGSMFLYYAEGEADERLVLGKRVGKYIAPELIVVLDHDLEGRGTYKVWVEGKPPDFALEVISPSSELRDRAAKKELYERIGIGEYFVFQPDPERPGPRLVGYALEGSRYRALGPDPDLSPEAGSVRSEALGVSFRPEGAFLRVRDLRSGKDHAWSAEWGERLEGETAARRQAEKRAARYAEEAARYNEQADQDAKEAARHAEARMRAEARITALEAKRARGT